MEQTMNSTPPPLSDDAAAAVATLARLGASERRLAMAALGWREPTRVWTPRTAGELPTLTQGVATRDREAIYGSDAWSRGYRRGTTIVVYLAQCPGLARLSADLDGVSLAKVGSSRPAVIERRIARLGVCGYGSAYRGPRRYDVEPGFDRFSTVPRLQLARQHPLSPVRLSGAGIEVDLPPNLTPAEFEASFNDVLVPVRLQTLAGSAAGRALCARTGVEPARLRRFYRQGETYKSATEITLLRPQADIGALARACADIVIDAALALRHRRPVR